MEDVQRLQDELKELKRVRVWARKNPQLGTDDRSGKIEEKQEELIALLLSKLPEKRSPDKVTRSKPRSLQRSE